MEVFAATGSSKADDQISSICQIPFI